MDIDISADSVSMDARGNSMEVTLTGVDEQQVYEEIETRIDAGILVETLIDSIGIEDLLEQLVGDLTNGQTINLFEQLAGELNLDIDNLIYAVRVDNKL